MRFFTSHLTVLVMIAMLSLSAYAQEQAKNPGFWYTDFDKAQQIAQNEEKDMILYFSGSDWCGPCKKLKKEVFTTDTFRHYASENWVFVYLDYPRYTPQDSLQRKHNKRIKKQYNAIGQFPKVVILTPGGEVIGHTGYIGYPAPRYIGYLRKLKARYNRHH